MICENCHLLDATIHTTIIFGDDVRHVDLCTECSEKIKPGFVAASQDGCHYCGSVPYCFASDLSRLASGISRPWALCKRCADEFYDAYSRKLPGLGTDSFTQEQFSKIPTVFGELDQHMKQWLSRR